MVDLVQSALRKAILDLGKVGLTIETLGINAETLAHIENEGITIEDVHVRHAQFSESLPREQHRTLAGIPLKVKP